MTSAVERLVRRERAVALTAILLVAAAAWAYVVLLARAMDMGDMDMPGYRVLPALRALMVPVAQPWDAAEFALVFVMWAVMMAGMMLPSAAPMILLYVRVGRQSAAQGRPLASAAWFAAGYLVAWTAFALAAAFAQWALVAALPALPMTAMTSRLVAGVLSLVAGLYQWSPLKAACLRQCQSPWLFVQEHGGYRGGARGALALGARHGLYCIGCCWALMALLFAFGVMNVAWIALLAILVLVEKIVVTGLLLSRLIGLALVAAGGVLLFAAP
jgi:predicted metal-binding membrane protein